LNGINAVVGQTFKPAGLANAKGIISDTSFKDPTEAQWQNDAGYKWWSAFMDKYLPSGDRTDLANVIGPSIAATTVQVGLDPTVVSPAAKSINRSAAEHPCRARNGRTG
jgi:branched-chain amino acid transport system substrate-binding protein